MIAALENLWIALRWNRRERGGQFIPRAVTGSRK